MLGTFCHQERSDYYLSAVCSVNNHDHPSTNPSPMIHCYNRRLIIRICITFHKEVHSKIQDAKPHLLDPIKAVALGRGGVAMFIWAWRNYPVATLINVESNTTTLPCIKGILTVFVSAAGKKERQLSPFCQPTCCVAGLHEAWVLPRRFDF